MELSKTHNLGAYLTSDLRAVEACERFLDDQPPARGSLLRRFAGRAVRKHAASWKRKKRLFPSSAAESASSLPKLRWMRLQANKRTGFIKFFEPEPPVIAGIFSERSACMSLWMKTPLI
jgi:hypothetical protein